jgi:alpha-ketoglutarate-dependent taurine dioxygenase
MSKSITPVEQSPLAPRAVPGKPVTLELESIDTVDAGVYLAAQRTALDALLAEHGALLLRGLELRSVDDFARVRDALIDRHASYKEKATPRSDFGKDVYSSTDLPPSQDIRLHNEISYTLEFPRTLVFACLEAPEVGGATPVADVRRVLERIPAGIVEPFRRRGWLLTRNFDRRMGLAWEEAFATDEPAEVERYCDANAIGYEWREDGRLRTTQRRSAIVTHPLTGDEVWFNHVAFWNQWTLDAEIREVLVDEYGEDNLPFDTSYGDGAPIPQDVVDTLNAAYDDATVREPWQVGDVLLVDNVLTAHGRDAFRGSRRIVVAMGEPTPLAACRPTVEPTPVAVDGGTG